MPATKQQIRQIIADNNLNSVADVYSLLRDSFKDILQELMELMEAELDASLGYEKNQKGDSPTSNKRNGHSPKTLKSQYGEFQIDVPRDREGEFEPKLIPKYQRDISGIEEKVISLDSFNHKFVMNLKGQLSHNLEVDSDPLGNIARINHALESMPKRRQNWKRWSVSLKPQKWRSQSHLHKKRSLRRSLKGFPP